MGSARTCAPDLTRRLDEALAGRTGKSFFCALARALAEALQASCAFVCEFTDNNTRARPIAFWLEGSFADVAAYELAGTPCECVLAGDIVVFADRVAERFPHHRHELEAISAQSYIAIPMRTRTGSVIGHIAVIDTCRRGWGDADAEVLRLCSARASVELDHEMIERRLAAANQELEARVAERTLELEQANAEMEQRVAERTASLAAVNARLRHEVAARTEAESALRRQEEAYRDLYENAPTVYWSTGADGFIRRVNRRAEELFGYPRGELVGKAYIDLVAPGANGHERALVIFGNFLEGRPTLGEELEFRAADGRSIWAHVSVVPIFDETGKPIATRSTLEDITERKLAEASLNRRLELERLLVEVATAFVGASSARVSATFAEALEKIGIWGHWDMVRAFFDDDGRNAPRVSHIWTADADEKVREGTLLDTPPAQAVNIPNVDEIEDTVLRRRLESLEVGGLIAIPVANAAQTLGWVEFVCRNRPHDWRAEDVQLFCVLGDIIASTLVRARMERELEDARSAAESASRAKSDFLARMSHELRTPLNAILGYAQLMQRDPALATHMRDQAQVIRRSGEHLLTLINEVLDLARVESGRLDIREAEFDLPALVYDIESMFRPRAEESGLSFVADSTASLPSRVRGDDARLRQILINLLGNAIKFTPQGGTVSLRLGYRKLAATDTFEFRIEDDGVGIPADRLERIFEPFYQVTSGGSDGIGLGLAITRRLVEALAGSIVVASELGRGTQFTVRVPMQVVERAAVEAGASPQHRIVGIDGRAPRILIVDDRRENREVLRDFLAPLGFGIVEAADGRAAVEAVESQFFDLLLVDLLMPELGGIEAVERIRSVDHGVAAKIVAVTAHAFTDVQHRCEAGGFDAFLTKPVVLDELLDLIRRLLDLEWRYAAVSPERRNGRGAFGSSKTPPPSSLSSTEAIALYRLAKSGDVTAIKGYLADLVDDDIRHRDFARYLEALADRFDLVGIERSLAGQADAFDGGTLGAA